MTSERRAWLQMHLSVLLWGFTAILGKLITLDALPLVWWRMTLVTAALLLVGRFWTGLGRLSARLIATYSGIGILVAAHWLLFYGSIKLSNASVAATCMALTPVSAAFVEPFLVGRRFEVRELALGLAVIPGVALVVGGTPEGMRPGIVAGVGAAIVAAVFSSLNKRFVERGSALTVTGIEMGAGAAGLAAFAIIPSTGGVFVAPSGPDFAYLVVLAIACTLVPYALALVALRHLTAFATSLAVNMEPVYAIVLAILFLGEQHELQGRFYAGVGIILAVVFSYPMLAIRRGTGSDR